MKRIFLTIAVVFFILTGCAKRESDVVIYSNKSAQQSYSVNGKFYHPKKRVFSGWTQKGIASWYGPNFHGKHTSNGEIYNMYAFTAAHKTLPMNTIVKVTNLNNGKSVVVRINDRGPFVRGRIIDLSYIAAKKIGLDKTGTAPVKLRVLRFKGKNHVKGYMIQIGAFSRYKGAWILSKKYKNLGYNTVIQNVNGLNKVFISGFKSYKEAENFKKNNNLRGFIVGD